METHFRDSMMWVHTWAGVVVGGLLFAIFWMGTLAVFDQEADRWMMPMTRLSLPEERTSPDAVWKATGGQQSKDWQFTFPTERTPVGYAAYTKEEIVRGLGQRPGSIDANAKKTEAYLDPRTYEALPDPGTRGGQDFFFPFHWNLTITSTDFGVWVVGAAGMAMMLLLVTGVIVHRTIFVNFFTLRAKKKAGRVVLDLHNIMGVLALPFHLMITLSGLVIWFYIYFPTAWLMVYDGNHPSFYSDTRARFDRPAAGTPGTVASIDNMVVEAERIWGSGRAEFVHVWHPEDSQSYVEIRRSYDSRIHLDPKVIYFDGPSGQLLHYASFHPIAEVQRFIAGLHFIRYKHWTLRWIYFVLGLAGCVLIATGSLFWLEARRKRHSRGDSRSIRIVEGLTIGGVSGIIVATLAFLIANRLLPLGMENRAGIEVWAFFLVWIATFAHGFWRRSIAWIEQTWMIAAGSVIAVLLNWLTTGDHLIKTLGEGSLAVAGVDLILLASAAVAVWTAQALQRKQILRSGVVRVRKKSLAQRETVQDA